MMPEDLIVKAGGLIASIGVVYGVTKATLASVVMRVGKVEVRADRHEESDVSTHGEMLDRLARIETKVDLIMEGRRLEP